MRVGIPRALLYYYYYPFWKRLFDELEIEVLVSEPTNKNIVNKGIELSVAEICVPIKVFAGHVASLVNKVDYVFIPRMMSIKKGEHFCPKFIGLPDIIRHTVPNAASKILSPKIQCKSHRIFELHYYKEIQKELGISSRTLSRALKVATRDWKQFRSLSREGYVLSDALDIMEGKNIEKSKNNDNVSIGLLGYVYDIYDDYVSMNIIKKLKEMDINIVTFEMLTDRQIKQGYKYFSRKLFWTFSNEVMGAAYYLYNQPEIDGLIHMTAFACGPDSLLGKILELDSNKFNKPYMTIRVDEHTGESHLQTRVEAFIDMIKRKKQKQGGKSHEGHLSIYGYDTGIQ